MVFVSFVAAKAVVEAAADVAVVVGLEVSIDAVGTSGLSKVLRELRPRPKSWR